VSLITNLQNIKYSLLADYNDEKIFDDVLLKMDVTDQLINEHLDQAAKKDSGEQTFLPRDPACFRKHMGANPV